MGMEDARRDQVKAQDVPLCDHGVARVVPAVVAGDQVGLPGQVVHHPAFPFVSPLGSDHEDCWHATSFG